MANFLRSGSFVLVAGLLWLGCSEERGLVGPIGPSGVTSLAKRGAGGPVEVAPMYRMPTGKPGEYLTVFVYYAKGGNGGGKGGGGGGKKPKDPTPTTETDTNNNEAHAHIEGNPTWAASSVPVIYNPSFEPSSVIGQDAAGAVSNGISSWNAETGNFFSLTTDDPSAPLALEDDDQNVIGWRQLVGKGARKVLAVTYVWSDNDNNITETDFAYNLTPDWAVNAVITAGTTYDLGTDFDVQAIGTHEIGHMLGLGHVLDGSPGADADATMAPTAAKGELKKQTLTQGDKDGAVHVH